MCFVFRLVLIGDRECTIPTYIAVATYSGFGFLQNLIDVKLLKTHLEIVEKNDDVCKNAPHKMARCGSKIRQRQHTAMHVK